MQNLCFNHADSKSRSHLKGAWDIAVHQKTAFCFLSRDGREIGTLMPYYEGHAKSSVTNRLP